MHEWSDSEPYLLLGKTVFGPSLSGQRCRLPKRCRFDGHDGMPTHADQDRDASRRADCVESGQCSQVPGFLRNSISNQGASWLSTSSSSYKLCSHPFLQCSSIDGLVSERDSSQEVPDKVPDTPVASPKQTSNTFIREKKSQRFARQAAGGHWPRVRNAGSDWISSPTPWRLKSPRIGEPYF